MDGFAQRKKRAGARELCNSGKTTGHPRMKQTLYFASLVDLQVSKETAKSDVKGCETCRSIDPAPVRYTDKMHPLLSDTWRMFSLSEVRRWK